MQQSKNDANDGYFVEPASHAAGTTYGAPTVEGMRIRLNSTFNISGYSAINQAILTALQQYGMIMADNGGYLLYPGRHRFALERQRFGQSGRNPVVGLHGRADDSVISRLRFCDSANRDRADD